jgi:hypothetical protein
VGVIRITIEGSFDGAPGTAEFRADARGHAYAVSEAIAWLASDTLARSIELDHKLHSEGHFPSRGFTA